MVTPYPIEIKTPIPFTPTALIEIPFVPAPIASPKSLSARMTDSKGIEMALVPAGEFLMGSTSSDKQAGKDEMPQHKVFLDDYYIDLTEVTNTMYRACEKSGACKPPMDKTSSSRSSYYDDPEFEDYPVINVEWEQARSYCEWRGARLPSEAEWEKAGRGTEAEIYPWGDQTDCSLANISKCADDTTKVGEYPSGASPYGPLDMIGNVWEWVQDWYLDTYYQSSPSQNPTGPASGEHRSMRGGSCSTTWENARGANRSWRSPSETNPFIGFRCARSP